ncbi:MAG: DUF6429 family protein [Anaerolineae bacterium]|nr:DUF6429 family protein [Anaerolineae bacterium]
MEYDRDKVDEMILALLYLTSSQDKYATRAWKGLDWQAMDRLHQKGYIGDPRGKSASVEVTPEGARLSKELFFKYFGKKD